MSLITIIGMIFLYYLFFKTMVSLSKKNWTAYIVMMIGIAIILGIICVTNADKFILGG